MLAERIAGVIAELQEVHAVLEQQAAAQEPASEPVEAAQAEPVPVEAVDAEQVRTAAEGHDNELPYKCPACGKTFAEAGVCTNGHAAEPTIATDQVLAGAPMTGEVTGARAGGAEAPGAADPSPPAWPS